MGGPKRVTFDEFFSRATKLHGKKYKYFEETFINTLVKTKILCVKCNFEFYQTPGNHLSNHGCPKCGGRLKLTKEDFIEKSQMIHGIFYDYECTNYVNNNTKVKIGCPFHGYFMQSPDHHMSGTKCPECANILVRNKRYTTKEFIELAKEVHGNRYNYENSNYKATDIDIEIRCPFHGSFWQKPQSHLSGRGCRECGKRKSGRRNGLKSSFLEIEWLNFLKIETRQYEIPVSGKRPYIVDGFDPQTNTIYEFYGDFWHGNPKKFAANDINSITNKTFGELYQKVLDKENLFKSLGYNLVTIWESEWKQLKNE